MSTKLTIDLSEDIREWIKGIAAERGETESSVIQDALQSYRAEVMEAHLTNHNGGSTEDTSSQRRASQEVFERERAAYERLEESLRPNYEGQYVAIRDGQVADSDADELTLIARVYDRFGYGPIYIRKVGSLLPVMRVPSPRLVP